MQMQAIHDIIFSPLSIALSSDEVIKIYVTNKLNGVNC